MINSALQMPLTHKLTQYLISGMKRCVRKSDSTFSIIARSALPHLLSLLQYAFC